MLNTDSAKKIIVVGCPRSGTTYISRQYRRNGLEVHHEQLGPDGTVNWCIGPMLADKYTNSRLKAPWGGHTVTELKQRYPNALIYHVVRHPQYAMSSMATISRPSWNFIQQFIDIKESDNIIQKVMKMWHYWNLLCEEAAVNTYMLEDTSTCFSVQTPKFANSRKHKIYSIDEFAETDPHLWGKIKIQANKYGYQDL